MQTTRSIFLGVAAAVLLAGCGSAASSSPASGAAAEANSSSAPASATAAASQAAAGSGAASALTCALAPSTMVSSDLGVSGLGAPKQEFKDGGAFCVYSGSNALVSLNLLNGSTADEMSAEQQTMAKSEQTKAFPGLGDEAFSATLSGGEGVPSSNTLVARQGTVEIMVVSNADVSAEKSLEEHLFAKIG
jgi:hypothetical protein